MCCGQPYTMLGLTLDLVRELKRMLVFYRDERSSRLLSVAREEPCHEHFRIDGKGGRQKPPPAGWIPPESKRP
jgi:hypothetical protein